MTEKGTYLVNGVPVTYHRQDFGEGDIWHNSFCFRAPHNKALRPRLWLGAVIDRLVCAPGDGCPGHFFANPPTIRKRGRRVIVRQRCGYDV